MTRFSISPHYHDWSPGSPIYPGRNIPHTLLNSRMYHFSIIVCLNLWQYQFQVLFPITQGKNVTNGATPGALCIRDYCKFPPTARFFRFEQFIPTNKSIYPQLCIRTAPISRGQALPYVGLETFWCLQQSLVLPIPAQFLVFSNMTCWGTRLPFMCTSISRPVTLCPSWLAELALLKSLFKISPVFILPLYLSYLNFKDFHRAKVPMSSLRSHTSLYRTFQSAIDSNDHIDHNYNGDFGLQSFCFFHSMFSLQL